MQSYLLAPITDTVIDLATIINNAQHEKAGAMVIFSGNVRNHNNNKAVKGLSYECFKPMAEKMINDIVQEAKTKYDLHVALCQHRIGEVGIGECAVVVITSSSHREAAYTANAYIIDRVKYEVPIWKREYYSNGDVIWAHNSGERGNF
jgi:molybdopterin synthase catalytic subunit